MVQNPDSNFGLMIRLQTEIANRCLCWCSSDYEIDSMRPKLVLTIDTCAVPVPEFLFQQIGDTFYFTNMTDSADAYLWDFGDGFGSNLASPVYVFKENGEYIVCLTVENECGMDQFCDTLVLTGISETIYEENLINIYPNPSRGFIMIDFVNDIEDAATIYIYSITGKLIECNIARDDHRYDVTTMPAGMYLMQVLTGNKAEIVKFQVLE